MPKSLDQVAQDAAELSESDRLKLARILLELSEEPNQPLREPPDEWEEEIQLRLSQIRTGEVHALPLEEVKKRVKARFMP